MNAQHVVWARRALLVLALSALWSTMGTAGRAETVVETDFATGLVPVHRSAAGNMEGVLPPGCVPDFGWNGSVCTATPKEEAGRRFLRVEVPVLDAWVHLGWHLKDVRIPGVCRVTVTYRTPSGELKMAFTRNWALRWYEVQHGTPGRWNTKTLLCQLDGAPANPVSLYLIPGQEGLDLSWLKVEKFTPEEEEELLAGDARTYKRPAPGARNFLRNSRFPLGAQAGWNLRPSGSTEMAVGPDKSERGPSGSPSLTVTSKGRGTLYSEPFQIADPRSRDNHLSFAVKGNGAWRLQVYYLKGSRKIGSYVLKALPVSSDWRTESIDLSLTGEALNARAFGLEFHGSGKLHLDSLQAWQGRADRPFSGQGEAEVALAIPESPSSDLRVQFADEPARFDYCVTGAGAGSTLKLVAANAYGVERRLPDVRLRGGKEEHGTAALSAFPETPLGQFRVEAWVERAGRPISPTNELLLTRVRRPVYEGRDAPDSPFGCHFEGNPLIVRAAKAAGMNWVRLLGAGDNITNWAAVEPKRGTWVFDDAAIDNYRKHHVLVLGGLNTAPPWASFYGDSGKKSYSFYHDAYYLPKDLADWRNYVRETVKHYRERVSAYFVWNEPWGGFWFGGYPKGVYTGDKARDFAILQKEAYAAAKEADPSVTIVGFNSTTIGVGRAWNETVFRSGGYDCCDAMDFHNYIGLWADQAQPGDITTRGIDTALGYAKANAQGPLKPVYMTEGQGIMPTTYGLYKRALVWDAPSGANAVRDADKAVRYFVANLAAGCSKVFLYSAHAYGFFLNVQNLLALVGPDGYPNLEYAATSNVAWQLEDTRFHTTVRLSDEVNAYVFRGGRQESVAVISGVRTARLGLSLPRGATLYDLFGSPVKPPVQYRGLTLFIASRLSAEELAEALGGV